MKRYIDPYRSEFYNVLLSLVVVICLTYGTAWTYHALPQTVWYFSPTIVLLVLANILGWGAVAVCLVRWGDRW